MFIYHVYKHKKDWILGSITPTLIRSKLPTKESVLKVLLFTLSVNNSLSVSFNVVASDILKIWQSCGIPCIRKDKVCKKIKALFDEYRLLKKHKYRRTKTQISREEKFKKIWKGLFDIATSNLDSMVSSTRIKLFLKNQRTKRNLKLKYLMHEAPIVSEPRCHTNTLIEDDTDTDEEVEVTTDTDTEYVANGASDQNLVEKSASDLVNKIVRAPAITSALDRIKLTSGKFRYLVGSVAKVVIASPSKSRISKNTIERNRKKNRKIIARNITTDFISKFASEACVIHWDGKLLTNVNGTIGTVKTKVDRIAVAVTSNGNSKLLGIPKGDRGTGENMANIMHKEILKWKLTNVVGLCADTTSSNTGWKSGASALLQGKYLNDQKIFFPCRHHIYELILSQVFILFFGKSTAPNIAMFVNFRNQWNGIQNKLDYEGIPFRLLQSPAARLLRSKTVQCLQQILSDNSTYIPRDDYRELIDLTLIILGVENKSYKVRTPGALHHARWMCKVIYAFKMYLFRKQLQLDYQLQQSLEEFCIFCSLLYVRYWLLCPSLRDAAINDLEFFKNLKLFEDINEKVADCAYKKSTTPLKCDGHWKRDLTPRHKNVHLKKVSDFINSRSLFSLHKINADVFRFMLHHPLNVWRSCPGYEKRSTLLFKNKIFRVDKLCLSSKKMFFDLSELPVVDVREQLYTHGFHQQLPIVCSGNAAFLNSSMQHSSRRCDGKPNPEPNPNNQHIQVIRLRNENQLLKDKTDSLKKQLYCVVSIIVKIRAIIGQRGLHLTASHLITNTILDLGYDCGIPNCHSLLKTITKRFVMFRLKNAGIQRQKR
ncbi:hypothetical protein Bhyg_07843 [Pseudolycoriella hygida]|uniref:Uncharacterized protein n=1 Tax=Pseudolycoriella hygida TaxID=35572 RepID=A0A9Q0N499_9DIPT|nr:hypothetical protein Bhyg_07843 [Pseudolycoriella hygida]